jgi:hypothetical protein
MPVYWEYSEGMKNALFIFLVCVSLTFLLASWALAQGKINGIAHLTLTDGKTLYADSLRILLVRTEAAVPKLPDLEQLDKFKRMETIRNLHMSFFLNVRGKMSAPDYIVQSTLTTPDGAFFFFDVPDGSYFILIAFPAMIQDYKVAWQIPVTVKTNQTTRIELNNENMVLPTYSRQ